MNLLSEEEYFYKLDNMVLIASQHLRSLFAARWKKESGVDWGQSETQGQEFIEGLGQAAYNKAMNAQKRIIAKGCLDDWDISVLSLVLQNLGDWVSYKSENGVVRQLTALRNELAHHPSKRLSLEEYNIKVDKFRLIMQGLGLKDEEIEQVITKAGRSSSIEALKYTEKLYDRARGLLQNNKFEAAIRCYDEAITMPSLLPIHQGTAYEKRAECYIHFASYNKKKQLSIEVEDCCNQALKDAVQAVEIKEKSWQAHFTMAQAYRFKGDFEKAVAHCRQSLEISPVEKKVQNELASSHALLTIQKGNMPHLSSDSLPMNLAEKLVQYSNGYGHNVTEKEFLETMGTPKEIADKIPGHNFFVRGYEHLRGWRGDENAVEAVRYFTKAAKLGSADALHSLGICYRTGEGVAQDVFKAFECFHKAAHLSPDSSGRRTLVDKNFGVAAAQHDLGVMYDHGIVMKEDPAQALHWYQKSAENGNGSSAVRLGYFYIRGEVVPQNDKLAEFHWLQGIKFGNAEAAFALVIHYKLHMEPEKALNMVNTGRKMGHPGLTGIRGEEIMAEFKAAVRQRDELLPELVAFEKQHKLNARGLTFMERSRRRQNILDPKPTSVHAHLQSREQDWRLVFATLKHIKKWETAAENGSLAAAGCLSTLEASSQIMKLISENNYMKEEKAVELVTALYYRLTTVYQLKDFQPSVLKKIEEPVKNLLKSQYGKKGDVEMKARFCFVGYNLSVVSGENIARGVELLKEGLTMYPDNVHYYISLCHLYCKTDDTKSGFNIVTRGLEKFPEDLELLFANCECRSLMIRNPNEIEEVIDDCKAFLDKAPQDFPKVPRVCYRIAQLNIKRILARRTYFPTEKLTVEMYFNLGKQAEEEKLSLGLVSLEHHTREQVESFLRDLEEPETEKKILYQDKSQADDELVKPASTIAPHQLELGVLQRKLHLTNPVRKRLMLSQRKLIKEMAHLKIRVDGSYFYKDQRICKPKVSQKAPKGLFKVTPITLSEMSPTEENIYHNRSIDLTVVDEPNVKLMWVQLVAEDENGDPVLVFIYDLEKTLSWKLTFGRRISILNPYMQVGLLETDIGIRVDDQHCLVDFGGVKDMCRFCGEEDAKHNCANCKKAKYCSRQCQEHDWKLMKHKLICSYIKNCPLY